VDSNEAIEKILAAALTAELGISDATKNESRSDDDEANRVTKEPGRMDKPPKKFVEEIGGFDFESDAQEDERNLRRKSGREDSKEIRSPDGAMCFGSALKLAKESEPAFRAAGLLQLSKLLDRSDEETMANRRVIRSLVDVMYLILTSPLVLNMCRRYVLT
jgi:hypothetical protein